MVRRRHPDDEDDAVALRRRPDRSWSSRLAWCTLLAGGIVLVTRLSVATVVEIHGDGMAPTLVDGDHVVLLRGTSEVERGEIVVYDPGDALGDMGFVPGQPPPPTGQDDTARMPDARKTSTRDLRNTAVVDPAELEDNWERIKARSDRRDGAPDVPLRLGRVLARPGDRVTFHQDGGALGLAIDGSPIGHKQADSLRISLTETETRDIVLRALAYETTQERRYPVLVRSDPRPEPWSGVGLPPAGEGPVELEAPGYLVVADNRDGGACCDSRALGWIPADALHGKVTLRLPGDPTATPDLDPSARGLLWDP